MGLASDPRLCLLGPPGVWDREGLRPLVLQAKTLAVLGYVADVGTPVSRRELARLLFVDAEDPRAALRWHLAKLRSAFPADLGGALHIGREDVSISFTTDIAEFRAQAEQCLRQFDPQVASSALSLYRGAFLHGLAATASAEFDTWLLVREEALRTLFRRVTLAFAQWALNAGRVRDALEPLARLVAADPYVEEGHVQFILALVAAGEIVRARTAYRKYERTVRDELHAEPRPEVAELFNTRDAATDALPRDGYVSLRDVTLHFVEWPGGEPPVLCLHGAVVSGYVFTTLARHLSPEFRVIAPTRRGNGFSDKPRTGYEVERHVADLVDLMTALRIERPVLIGHSTGGGIAALLAERCDARGLVLLDGAVGSADALRDRFRAATVVLDQARTPIFDFDAYLEGIRRTRAPYTPEAERLLERIERFQVVRMPDGSYRQNVDTRAVEETWASIVSSDTLAAVQRLSCPVLVVWATEPWLSDEAYFSEAFIRAQTDAARHGELVIASRSTHASVIRDPEPLVIAAVRRLLRRCASTGVSPSAPATRRSVRLTEVGTRVAPGGRRAALGR